ncbi:Hypothetical predicted protein [Olea europaea subsp. europaea]|uniref:Uncharacterized protein n=1 Tax=Olea europaea subsp. europaea TaxID=158383 RepID=A0A8S0TG35_OLEEU|nr:Hypothetical predicted protein [Olea europaea subsp. europaea]
MQKANLFHSGAYICCHYRPNLLSDTRLCLNVLPVDLANVEISTLEDLANVEISTLKGQVKIVFLLATRRNKMNDRTEAQELIVSSIHEALSCVVDKASASEELSQLMLPSN